MRKAPLIISAVVAAGALALTACSNGSSGNSGGGLGGSSSSSASGSGGGVGSNAGKTFEIGYQGALSGDNKQLGINEVNAVQLAVDQANKSGNLGFTLKLVQADDGGTTAGAPTAAAKLLQDSNLLGVVGPAFSGPTTATGAKYAAASMALISPSATNATQP